MGKSVVSLLPILTPGKDAFPEPLGKAKIQFHRNVKEGMVGTQSGIAFLILNLLVQGGRNWVNGQKRILGLDLFARVPVIAMLTYLCFYHLYHMY